MPARLKKKPFSDKIGKTMKTISAIESKFALQVLEDIKEEISVSLGDELKEIILYGSYARNQQTADSDIDIIVLLDEKTADMSSVRQKLADIKVDLSLKYDVVISVITKPFNQYVRNRDLVPFYSTIDKEGVELYVG